MDARFDFEVINGRYLLKWKKNPDYVNFLLQPIIENKREIFLYIQAYYRAFMKQKLINEYPVFVMGEKK